MAGPGRNVKTSDEEVLQVFVDSDDPFLGTTYLADELGYSTNDGMIRRLNRLEEDGYIGKRQSGGFVWWITEKGRDYLDSLED